MNGLEKQFLKKLIINMKNLLFLFLFTFFCTNISIAEIVKKIEITGNNRVSDETVKIYGKITANKNYNENDLNKILNNLNSTNFFENVNLTLINGLLKIELTEYPTINKLVILGEPTKKYEDEIIKIITSKEKDSFIKSNLANDSKIIKNLYSTIGYNFVSVDTKIRKIDDFTLDLIFEINKGEQSKIKKITFTGDKKIREKRLRDIIASEEDRFWKFISRNTNYSKNLINLDTRLLTNYYKSIGYYDVNVNSSSAELKQTGEIEVIYSIDAGTRYLIKKITTNTDPVFDNELFFPLEKDYKKLIGSYYSPFKVKKLLESIDELISTNNLQFVEHSVRETVEEDSITIQFNISEGAKVLVERINILGNNVTNESVIRSALLIDEGDPFTNINMDKSISKIKSKNIFGTVTYEVLEGSKPDLKVVNISIEEKPTGELSAGAGLGTDGGSVAFMIKENNLLGEGNNLSFDVDLSAESLKGTLSYTNPNYDLYGNSLTYSVSSTSNDKPDQGYENTVFSGGVSTQFEQYKDVYASLGITATYDDLQTDSSASSSLKKQNGTYNELLGTYGFMLDKRNRAFMPTEGHVISFAQDLPIYADKAVISNRLSGSIYNEFSENIIGAAKLYAASSHGLGNVDIRLSKRKKLSTSRLRGFKRGKIGPVDGADHIGGNYSTAVNLEASLPKVLPESTKTDIGLFLDFGNVWGVDYDSTIDDSNKIRSSIGAAASWNSPLGPMTFVLSQNIIKASTDITESFNFNLGTTF